MHNNRIFLSFILLLSILTLWFGGKAALALHGYARLSLQAPAFCDNFTLREEKGGKYRVIAHYTFSPLGKKEAGSSSLGPAYKNPWSAHSALEALSQQKTRQVWYHPKKPQLSALEKHFPTKALFSALLVLCITLYFFGLGIYVAKRDL